MGGPVFTVRVLPLTNHVLATDEELWGEVIDQVGVSRATGLECVREKCLIWVGATVCDTPVGRPLLRELLVQRKLGVPVSL